MTQKNKIIVIAEAGVNHDGSITKAKKLIDIAKNCGADFIKFQSFNAENLVTKKTLKAKYQILNTANKKEKYQFNMLKKLELSKNEFMEIIKYSKERKIKFLCSPFDIENINFLKKNKLTSVKIPSGEITNLLYLKEIGLCKFKTVFLSTGMSNIKEIKEAINILLKYGILHKNINLLHCNSEYPTPYKDVNLNVLTTFKKFNMKIGYSDHTLGDHIAVAAIAMGSKIIEKRLSVSESNFWIGYRHFEKAPNSICFILLTTATVSR